MRTSAALAGLLGLFLQCVSPCFAQGTAERESLMGEIQTLKKEVTGLKNEVELLREEIAGVKNYLRMKEAVPDIKETLINVAGDPMKGYRGARVAIIEFSEYHCPYCARFVQETLPQIEMEYVLEGKVQYFFKDFPNPMNEIAFTLAEAANCAQDQGKFWEMHDRLFAHQSGIKTDELREHAEAVGLDGNAFQQCLQSKKHDAEIRRDIEEGKSAGVRGTPAFLLGFVHSDSTVRAVKMIRGAQPFTLFKPIIEILLQEQYEKTKSPTL